MEPQEILKRPYAKVLTPESNGQHTAEIMEFPGCVAYGDTAAEALVKLDEVASEWLAAAIEQRQSIPEPFSTIEYSGKLVVRMPKGLHQRAALYAEREGVSLNQFIVACLAESVGERSHVALPARHTGADSINEVYATAGSLFQQPGSAITHGAAWVSGSTLISHGNTVWTHGGTVGGVSSSVGMSNYGSEVYGNEVSVNTAHGSSDTVEMASARWKQGKISRTVEAKTGRSYVRR